MIRDDLLDSERVLNCTPEARWLYVAILLQADDVGLFEATPFKLARKADLNRDRANEMVAELVGQDLVRLYKHAGKQYGFVPRFKQRLQIKRAKFPLPPHNMLDDDEDALKKIKHLASDPTVDNGDSTVNHRKARPEPEPEPEEEIKRPRSVGKQRTAASKAPFDEIVKVYHEALSELPAVRLMPAKRKALMQKVWVWVLTSKLPDGVTPRATNADEALAWFRKYFERASTNDFLMGRGRRSEEHAHWRCDFDFLLTDKGMKHVIEKTE